MNGTEKGVLVSYFTLFYIQVDTVQGWQDGVGIRERKHRKEIGNQMGGKGGKEGEREHAHM